MKYYLIQVRNTTSSDSSHRVYRFTYMAANLEHLRELLEKRWSQHEVDILAVEEG